MEIPEKLREVLKKDGVVAIATLGQDGPHMVNTWNSYVRLTDDGRMLIPAGYMNQTEANVAFNPEVLITLGSSKVPGNTAPGRAFSSRARRNSSRRVPIRHPQSDLRLDARRRGRHDALGDADAVAGGRSSSRDQRSASDPRQFPGLPPLGRAGSALAQPSLRTPPIGSQGRAVSRGTRPKKAPYLSA